jgi:uncharacterized membrane protein YhaH (DUF805 family)
MASKWKWGQPLPDEPDAQRQDEPKMASKWKWGQPLPDEPDAQRQDEPKMASMWKWGQPLPDEPDAQRQDEPKKPEPKEEPTARRHVPYDRIGRLGYLVSLLFGPAITALGVTFCLGVSIMGGMFGALGEISWEVGSSLGVLGILAAVAVSIIGVYMTWAGMVYRLHDMGASGWWSLLFLVPGVDAILVIVLLLAPGDSGANQYGDPADPAARALGIMWIIIVAIGVLVPIVVLAAMGRFR